MAPENTTGIQCRVEYRTKTPEVEASHSALGQPGNSDHGWCLPGPHEILLAVDGIDKLTQGPGAALHRWGSTDQKCVICLHFESYLQEYSTCDSLSVHLVLLQSYLHAPVFLPAIGRVIGRHRRGLAQASGSDPI